jgi:hypothetical protein
MDAKYQLEVVGPRASDIHGTRNFAEELHFTLQDRGWGTTSNPDAMTTQLLVIFSAKRRGDGLKLLHQLLAKHFMETDVNVQRL